MAKFLELPEETYEGSSGITATIGNLFLGFSGITGVEDGRVSTIGKRAFANCKDVSVNIQGYRVTADAKETWPKLIIGEEAFLNFKGKSSVYMGNQHVSRIEKNAFTGSQLFYLGINSKKVNFKVDNPRYNYAPLEFVHETAFDGLDTSIGVDFSNLFCYCKNLKSAPRLWEKYPDAAKTDCYRDCTNLPFYNEIPSGWK